MAQFKCTICGYVYDEEKGDAKNNIKMDTKFMDIPDTWVCPICGASKDMFEEVKAQKKYVREYDASMKPIGLLMIEHRLIERMVGLIRRELEKIIETDQVDQVFIDDAVDFFRTYTDRTHHGKEEDILFVELIEKEISKEHKKIMNELIEDHVLARQKVSALARAKESYVKGNGSTSAEIIELLSILTNLYPPHIEKEDKIFFIPIMEYFSEKELNDMLWKFWDFDKKMIHEKYQKVIEQLENKDR